MSRACFQDRILLIDEGEDVLYGNLNEIRRRFSGHAVLVRAAPVLSQAEGGELPTVAGLNRFRPTTMPFLHFEGVTLEKFEIAVPTLDEIFIRVVEGTA